MALTMSGPVGRAQATASTRTDLGLRRAGGRAFRDCRPYSCQPQEVESACSSSRCHRASTAKNRGYSLPGMSRRSLATCLDRPPAACPPGGWVDDDGASALVPGGLAGELGIPGRGRAVTDELLDVRRPVPVVPVARVVGAVLLIRAFGRGSPFNGRTLSAFQARWKSSELNR